MLQLTALAPADRDAAAAILAGTGAFSADECAVALELFDLGVAPPGTAPRDASYRWIGARLAGDLVGIACHGPTPATRGTHDLYWIAVHPAARGTGAGQALLDAVDRAARAENGRLLVAETSSRGDYERTRTFYRRAGFDEVARVRDFYGAGDDRVILTRRVTRLAEPASAP